MKAAAIFTGTAVAFNSSVLLDQPGSTGLKTLAVSVTNNFGLPIGVDSNGNNGGFKVLFGHLAQVEFDLGHVDGMAPVVARSIDHPATPNVRTTNIRGAR